MPKTANDITARLTRVINASAVNEVAYSWGRLLVADQPGRELAEPSAGGGGVHHGTPPHPAPRLSRIGQAHTRSPQDLTDGGPSSATICRSRSSEGGTPRHEDGRSNTSTAIADLPLHQLRRHARRAGRNFPRTSSRCSRSTTTSRRGTSTRWRRSRASISWPSATSTWTARLQLRHLGAGRLDARQADDEPRRPLRLHRGHVGRRSAVRSVGAGAAGRQEQHPAAPRLRLQHQRSHGRARRLGSFAAARSTRRTRIAWTRRCQHPGELRRPSGLPDEPVQRPDPDLRAGRGHRRISARRS